MIDDDELPVVVTGSWEQDLRERSYQLDRFLPSTVGVDPVNITGHTGYTNHFMNAGYWNPIEQVTDIDRFTNADRKYEREEQMSFPITWKRPLAQGSGPFTIEPLDLKFEDRYDFSAIDEAMANWKMSHDRMGQSIANVGSGLDTMGYILNTSPIGGGLAAGGSLPSWALPAGAVFVGLAVLMLLKK